MAEIFRRQLALARGEQRTADESIAEFFHENTKIRRLGAVATEQTYTLREIEAMAQAFKRYRLHPQVPLPRIPAETGGASFSETIAKRRSGRVIAPDPITLADASAILQWSYGITGEVRIPGGEIQYLRAAPSAGALYPAEIYLGVSAIDGLDAGIYHYEVPKHALALLDRGDPASRLHQVCCGQDHARRAAMVVLISGVIERTKRKYGDRGYRYVLLDIGHLGQNLFLACTALGLTIITTCAFFDDEAADLLGIDGCDESVMYVAFIGKMPREKA